MDKASRQRNLTTLFWVFMSVLIICSGCSKQATGTKEQDLKALSSKEGRTTEGSKVDGRKAEEGTTQDGHNKKVILIVVDSLQSNAIATGIEQGILPTFQYLIEKGQYYPDFVSSFPTMSVTIDSTLLTGTNPNQHHVPGLVWYSSKDKRLVNYGTGPLEIMKYGFDPVIWNALLHLNREHLSEETPTIFEELAEKGLTSGSINGLIYRGNTEHTIVLPNWLDVISSLPQEMKVKGPDFMALGALSNPLTEKVELPEGLTDRLGLNDQFSIASASYLIENNLQPDFLYVYLPNMDQELHKKGPSELSELQKVDSKLATLLQAFGSPEEAVKNSVIIVMGDSGVTQMLPQSEGSVIHLGDILRDFRVMDPGGTENGETDLALAINESMAYLYKFTPRYTLEDIADVLLSDNRIDIVAWKDKDWIHALQSEDRNELQYKAKGKFIDSYQQSWSLKGNTEVLNLQISDNSIQYKDYPDALQRLSAALHSHEGEFLVVTAKPGYELAFGGSPTHAGGGGHGSLYATDSILPVIIYGTNQAPTHRRVVDMKSYIMKLLTKD